MRRAKIVCTLGPATESAEQIRALVDAGMDVARLNLSHGTRAYHEAVYQRVRAAADATGRGVGIMADLQGPKIRLGAFAHGPVHLERGAEFTITTEDVAGDATIASTTHKGLPGDVGPGDTVLVDDGRVALEVVDVEGPRVKTRVVEGGEVSDHKGLNLPGANVTTPAMSDKDIADLRWALHLQVDMIAMSFVRSAADIEAVHAIMDEEGTRLPVIAKIEKPQAVTNLEEIVRAFDGIMVARGDLGVELPLQQVPMVQKRAVALARRLAKPAIVATQMLDSMISAPRPTRAEVSDVANAVLDGADAVMLSGETSVGRYPVEAVRTMASIVETTEEQALSQIPPLHATPRTRGGAVTLAASQIGDWLGAKFLVAFTHSGDTARRMARLRSPIPVLAFTPVPATRSQLALTWGVETFLVPVASSTDDMVRQVDKALHDLGRWQEGDSVVIVAGTPPGRSGTTNTLRLHHYGESIPSSASS